MNKKIVIGTTLTLVIILAVFANTAVAFRISPISRRSAPEILTEITTFDEECSGWKFFSVPFDASLSPEGIRITYQDTVMTLQDSFNRGILHEDIFVFDNENNQWNHLDQFETGKAYLAYAYVSDDITISAVGTYKDSSEPIMLYQDWNYFGLPTRSTIPLSSLRFSCASLGLSDLTLDQADGLLVSKHMFYATNTDDPFYDLVDLDKDIIMPGAVYLIGGLVDNVEMSFVASLK